MRAIEHDLDPPGKYRYVAVVLNWRYCSVDWYRKVVQRDEGLRFIKPDDGGSDVFVHIRAVEKAGYTGLAEGARICFELKTGSSGKMSAENLRIG